MSEVSVGIARWLEQKRRMERASAVVISAVALGSGAAVFLLATAIIYAVLSLLGGALVHPVPWLWLAAFGLTGGFFARAMKGRQENPDVGMDPMGFWILKDIGSIGPRLVLEGLRQIRYCGRLGELNVAACALALAYLARQNTAVTWEELI